MKILFSFFLSLIFLTIFFSNFQSTAIAADIRTGDEVNITSDEKNLGVFYLLGNFVNNREFDEKIISIFKAFTFYKLITDIIISILFIYFFAEFLKRSFVSIATKSYKKAIEGFAFLILTPLASIILLFFLWLGIISFLFYFLVLIISIYVVKIFLGWFIIRWWYRRDKKEYVLDWKAGVIGSLALFLLVLIPFIGWLILIILYLISIGAVINELALPSKIQLVTHKKK